ncbi:zinc finger transcription factor of the Zn(2)-Cys(6) binuclear cluster domain type [Scheffersomyces coipomensis]|uniref:zinc finger transcription factor of the Zn(2)-Cys(6) binuclear cluster domain type n=1 Tax=Scheffersomyces coipomensis TaxID=1788519 RepID=UPI00315D3786
MVASDRRKKVTKACDYCKKRKYKCSGRSPCELCSKKKIECRFSFVDRRTIKTINKTQKTSNESQQPSNSISKAVSQSISDNISVSESIGSNSSINIMNDSPTKTSGIPQSLQPLLSFPLEEAEDIQDSDESNNNDDTSGIEETNDFNSPRESNRSNHNTTQLSNNEGKSSRLLFDSAGNLRYIGESSPLSLLFECRNIYRSTIGECEFTQDPQGINIIDEPARINNCIPVQLPKREHCNILVKFFETNVNTTWYVFNMQHFKEQIVNYIYENPIRAGPEKLILLHLVLALGLLYAETSKSFLIDDLASPQINSLTFFESGSNLMRNTVDNGKLWLSEAYFLIYFYYQSTSKRSTSWIMLGNAIRNAQALGLHRKFINESFRDKDYIMHRRKLWRSLYVCDRVSSILLGRPLLIGDYDWDDYENEGLIEYEGKINHDKSTYCLIEVAKVCKINGKIVQDFYLDGIIDPERAEKLAIELKLWSIDLPRELQLDRILFGERQMGQQQEIASDNFALLFLHISQLYGIMLLSKPFFMYIVFKRNSKENGFATNSSRRNKHETTMVNFCKASVKSSVLTIQLIHMYKEKHPQRVESYVTVNCCFMAALILGLSILHRNSSRDVTDEFSITYLMEVLNAAKDILSFYGLINATSKRFYHIVDKMQRSLVEAFGDAQRMLVDATNDFYNNRSNMLSLPQTPYFNSTTDLKSFMNFQQFFVPSTIGVPGNNNNNFATRVETPDADESLDVFMCNVGINDILFDGNI